MKKQKNEQREISHQTKAKNPATLKLSLTAHSLLKLLSALTLKKQKELIHSLLLQSFRDLPDQIQQTVREVMDREHGTNWSIELEQENGED